MKLEIRSKNPAGFAANVWIDGERALDVTDITLNVNPAQVTTATITRLVDELDVDVEAEEPETDPGGLAGPLARMDAALDRLRVSDERIEAANRRWWQRSLGTDR